MESQRLERMRDQSKMRHQRTECPNVTKWKHLSYIQQHGFHSCASSWRTYPQKEVSPTAMPGTRLPAENLSLTGNKSGKWLKSQRDSTVLVVAFHRVAVPELSSCCLILLSYQRNWRREGPVGHPAHSSLGLWCFLPTVPLHNSSAQLRFQAVDLGLEPWGILLFIVLWLKSRGSHSWPSKYSLPGTLSIPSPHLLWYLWN